MVKPFRFGVSTSTAGSAAEWRERARKAEDLGYDVFHVADHLRQSFQPMIALAFAAEATKSIRLGTFVINNDFRHPVVMAREAASVDFLSGGRLEFGIGAGHAGDEYREAGMPFNTPRVRVSRLAESVEVIRRLWTEESVTFEGEHFQLKDCPSFPNPAQARIPVLIGGNGRNVLELAARQADIVGFTGIFLDDAGRGVVFPHFTAEGLANRVEVVRQAAGERFGELELNLLVQGVETERPRERAEEWASTLKLDADDLMRSPFTAFGSVDQLEQKLLEQREQLGISYICTHWPGVEALAPVVARLRGK